MGNIIPKKKDWLILAGYVALIYATLPYMPRASSFFSSLFGPYFRGIGDLLVTGVIIIAFMILFKANPSKRNPMFYIGITAVFILYLGLLFSTPIVAEKMHILEYGFLSYLALRAARGMRPVWAKYLFVVFIIILVGYCDELIQKFTPGRFYQMNDIVLNTVSGMLGLFAVKLLGPEHYR